MPRNLKVFRTHLGFYDMIVAAPSQKAALEAWGASPHLFAQGFATVETDPRLVAAALEKPGAVLRRQFGSKGEFQESGGALRIPKAGAGEAAERRERDRRATAAAERAKRQTAGQQEREEAAAKRAAHAEQRSSKRREREESAAKRADQRAAIDKAREAASRWRDEEAASAGARRVLQAKLKALMQERNQKLRDIERREDAIAKERREIEQSFETRLVAIQREIRKT